MSILQQATIDAIKNNETTLLTGWIANLEQGGSLSDNRISRDDVSRQAKDFLRLLTSENWENDSEHRPPHKH